MKKLFSCFLALCIAFCVTLPAFAADAPTNTVSSCWFSGGRVLYICMDEEIRGVTDSFAVTLQETDDLDDLTHARTVSLDPSAVQWVLPYPASNDRLEVWCVLPEDTAPDTYVLFTVSGLLDADNNAAERTGKQYMFSDDAAALTYPSQTTSDLIHIFAGEIEPGYTPGNALPRYCVEGEALTFSLYAPAHLNDRLQLVCDGVELTRGDDGTYTAAAAGKGTVSLCVAGHVLETLQLQILTKQEMKSLLFRTAARHPLNVGKAYAISVLGLNVGFFAFPPLLILGLPFLAGEAVLATAAFPFVYVGYLIYILVKY